MPAGPAFAVVADCSAGGASSEDVHAYRELRAAFGAHMLFGGLVPDEPLAVGTSLRHLVHLPFPGISAEVAFAGVPVLIPPVRPALGTSVGVHGREPCVAASLARPLDHVLAVPEDRMAARTYAGLGIYL